MCLLRFAIRECNTSPTTSIALPTPVGLFLMFLLKSIEFALVVVNDRVMFVAFGPKNKWQR